MWVGYIRTPQNAPHLSQTFRPQAGVTDLGRSYLACPITTLMPLNVLPSDIISLVHLQSVNNNWFVSRPPLNKKNFIDDVQDGLWIFTETLFCPVSHVELCYPSHMFILVWKTVAFLYREPN